MSFRFRPFVWLVTGFALTSGAMAQPGLEAAQLVLDINPSPLSSAPALLGQVGNVFIFSAYEDTHGRELWRTDGTASGTSLLVDFVPGPGSSNPGGGVVADGVLYFAGYDQAHGAELWRTDGTSDGTQIVRDIVPGEESPGLRYLTEYDGNLMFLADDGVHGEELWKSDGTALGTVMINEIYYGGGASPFGVSWMGFTQMDALLYFSASDGTHGTELWSTDGTSDGTIMIRDIYPGGSGSYPDEMAAVAGELIFTARVPSNDYRLWKSDGTKDGTVSFDNDHRHAAYMTGVGPYALFRGSDSGHGNELWRTDGTGVGTEIVKDIFPGTPSSSMWGLGDVDGALLFRANNGVEGHELWRSDGTEFGTEMVTDLNPGSEGCFPAGVYYQLPRANDLLFFSATDGIHGLELWRSDGTVAGTRMLSDIWPGPLDSGKVKSVSYANSVGGGLYFFSGGDRDHAWELWRTDDTSSGTEMILDINTDTHYSAPRSPAVIKGKPGESDTLIFGAFGKDYRLAYESDMIELWRTDGTPSGTEPFFEFWQEGGDPTISEPVVLGDKVVFAATAGTTHGVELWITDGTTSGTTMPLDIHPGPNTSEPMFLTPGHDVVFFSADDGTHSTELWKSDGTASGTLLVADLRGPQSWKSSNPQELTYVPGPDGEAGLLYFNTLNDSYSRSWLWRSDGTTGGTLLIGDDARPKELAAVMGNEGLAGALFFRGYGVGFGGELWKSDGTVSGTVMVRDIAPGPAYSFVESIIDFNGTAFFLASDGVHGKELWRSDGTSDGTVLVRDIRPGAPGWDTDHMLVVGDTLYFEANDGVHGSELWKTDGTSEGTAMVCDATPGSVSGGAENLTDVGGLLCFTSWDPDTRRPNVWVSDGTSNGTMKVSEINVSTDQIAPEWLASMTPRGAPRPALFFSGDDGDLGSELWRIDPSSPSSMVIDYLLGWLALPPHDADANEDGLVDISDALDYINQGM